MKRRVARLSPLITLIGITFIHHSICTVMADETGIVAYDSSKFDPIPMSGNLPLFSVKDQRPTKQTLFYVKKRNFIPPEIYFRDGLQDSIEHSSSVIQDDGRELRFIIKDFRVGFEKKQMRYGGFGELTSTIEIDILINDKEKTTDIGNYKSVYFNNVSRNEPGTATSDIQNVLDNNLNKILKKIFTDNNFNEIVMKNP